MPAGNHDFCNHLLRRIRSHSDGAIGCNSGRILRAVSVEPQLRSAPNGAFRRRLRAESLSKLRSVAGLLFSLLLFVQFGNEWAIAGWLPLFLIHRLGINPESAIWALALYFGALMLGRLFAQVLLPRMPHRRMLIGSIVLAMLGYLALSFTEFLDGCVDGHRGNWGRVCADLSAGG